MIKLQDMTPEVYYRQSRDFQYLGRLYDVVLNYAKTNADVIYDIPSADAAYSDLVDLLAATLGFKPRHKYNISHLRAICSVLPAILKIKGTLKALKIALQALLTADGIKSLYYCEMSTTDLAHLIIFVPVELTNTTLLKDIISYILPAGITYELHRSTIVQVPTVNTVNNAQWDITYYNSNKDEGGRKSNRLIAIVPTAEALDDLDFTESDTNKPGFITTMSVVDDYKEGF